MSTLTDSHQELLRFAIAERDAFYDCATDHEGVFNDKHDHDELERMDAMIDRAQAALATTPSPDHMPTPLPYKIHERELARVITERDNAETWAEKLADAIGDYFDINIGEHSNCNCPWQTALENMPEPDHIGDANKMADEPTGQLLACDTCDSQTDDPWHYSTPTNRHMHACDVCWPEVQLIMLAEAKQALLSPRGVPPEDMAAAIQLEDEA